MKRVLFIAMALLVVAVGCKNRGNEVVTPPTTLEVAATEITVSDKAQRVEIEVVCNEEFEVKEEVYWLAVADVRDGETKVVVLSVLKNDSVDERSAEVVIEAGELRRVVTVKQNCKA